MTTARFIAGAACRGCGATDRIVVEDLPDGRVQRCVSCGHRETMRTETGTARTREQDEAATSSASRRLATIAIEGKNRSDR